MGLSGMHVADLDGDGDKEIVCGAGGGAMSPNYYWYVAERQPSGEFVQTYTSEVFPAYISNLRLWDYDGDGDLDVVVSYGNTIAAYDGATKSPIASFSTSTSTIRSLNFADVEGSSAKEFVFVDSTALYIYSRTGSLLAKVTGKGGDDVAVGNVNADRSAEIVIAKNSSPAYVLNGRTRAVIETFPQGIGAYVRVVDMDGDSIDEVIGAQYWYYVSCFKVGVSRTPIWQTNTGQDISTITIADVEPDGSPDIMIGQGQWGDIQCYNGRTGAFKWAFDNPEHGVSGIAVGNLDLDPALEIVHGAGLTHTGPDHLYVYDGQTRTLEWESLDLSGSFVWHANDYGDVDGDGNPDFVYASHGADTGNVDGYWFVHDAVTKALKFTGPHTTNLANRGIYRIRVANVDADPQGEVFVTGSTGYDGFVICYDGLTRTEQYRTPAIVGETMHNMLIADVDNDGRSELVCSSYYEHSGATGSHVFVYDAETGVQEWISPSLSSGSGRLELLRVANVDADPDPEIVVGDRSYALTVIDGITHVGQAVTGDIDIASLTTADLDGNGVQEIIMANDAGVVTVRDPFTGNATQTLGSFGAGVYGLQVVDVAGTSAPDLIFARAGKLNIVYKDAGNVTQTWQCPLAPGAGEFDSITVADIDNDGKKDVMVGDAEYGFRIYRISL